MKNINERPTIDRVKLAIRRGISSILNVCVLLGGMYIIIWVQAEEDYIIKEVTEYVGSGNLGVIEQVIGLVPTILISVFNIIIPTVTKILVGLEKWDFPEQVIKQEVWRSYVQKFINLTIYILIVYRGLLIDISYFNNFFAYFNLGIVLKLKD
mmetsp:Transcript_5649/g.8934  ORF Transcript_5649/g.8934 Transcript_5649/m.8934 type:complete len:153 (+) Transcript_5649:1201-1659(+)